MQPEKILDKLFRERRSNQKPNSKRWEFFTKITIKQNPTDKIPMLIRYRIAQTPLGGWYIHHHFRPDADRDCHDHPWVFRSIVLSGYYNEEYRTIDNLAPALYTHDKTNGWRTFPLHRAHRITFVAPNTWTLLFVGPKRRDWGFWQIAPFLEALPMPKAYALRWHHWQTYVKTRGAGPDPFDS